MNKNAKYWKKKGLEEIHVHMGMFDFGINIVFGKFETMEEYLNYKLEDEESWDMFEDFADYKPRGRYIFKVGYCPIVWMPKRPRTPREYGTFSYISDSALDSNLYTVYFSHNLLQCIS